MYLKELDSISYLSYDPCNNILQGAGLSKGSEGITIDGESIKAGKFPVLFYINNPEIQRLHKYKVSKRNSKLLSKYSGRDTLKTVSGIRSVPTLGNQNSD